MTCISSRGTGISLKHWHFSHTHKFQQGVIKPAWHAVSRLLFTESCNSTVRHNTNVINKKNTAYLRCFPMRESRDFANKGMSIVSKWRLAWKLIGCLLRLCLENTVIVVIFCGNNPSYIITDWYSSGIFYVFCARAKPPALIYSSKQLTIEHLKKN